MKCSQIRLYLKEYNDGQLDAALTGQITAHIHSCNECANELNFLQSYWHTVKKIPIRKAPAQFAVKVEQKIAGSKISAHSAMRPFWGKIRPLLVPATALAGILLMTIGMFAVYNPFKFALNKQNNNLAPGQPVPYSYTGPKAATEVPEKSRQLAKQDKAQGTSMQSLADTAGRTVENNAIPSLTLIIKLPASTNKKEAAPMAVLESSGQTSNSMSDDNGSESNGSLPNAEIGHSVPAPVIEKIEAVTIRLGGKLNVQSANSGSPAVSKLLVTLPSVNYQDFLTGIRQYGEFKEPISPVDLGDRKMITLMLELMTP